MWLAFAATGALFGHVALCVGIYNRLHATALRPRMLKIAELPFAAWFFAAPLWTGLQWRAIVLRPAWPLDGASFGAVICQAYGLLATIWGCIVIGRWARSRFGPLPPAVQSVDRTRLDDARSRIENAAGVARGWLSLPGNESLELELTHVVLAPPRLPAPLDGLRIAHLSDWHFTGRVPREFFELAVERANAWRADLIAVTGDFIDDWRCRDWLPETLGRLHAPHGVYFLLGNHDRWCGHFDSLRRELESLGLIDLGNRTQTAVIRDVPVLLAGTEEPWFGPAPTRAELEKAARENEAEFRLLLSHSPDQIEYARAGEFDLMLAGHTHGGQIRFPLIGPVIAPSRFGVRYASGVFQRGRTLLGVTRGLSGEEPIRWNCPPEACLWELRRSGRLDE